MKNFLKNIVLFLLFAQIPILIEVILPANIFSGSASQSLRMWHTTIYGRSYPNAQITMNESSNLSGRAKYSKTRNITTITDKLGYRNNQFIETPDVVIIGDSQAEGLGSDQDETLANLLMKEISGLKVYTMAPASVKDFNQILHDSIIKKPKIVIQEAVEREIPDFVFNVDLRNKTINPIIKEIGLNPYIQPFRIFVAKYERFYLPHYLRSKIFGRYTTPNQSPKDSTVFFHDGKQVAKKWSEQEINRIVKEFIKLNDYYKQKDIQFAFMPFPNKETIYWDYVPLDEQPEFLDKLIAKLKENNISVIDTKTAFDNNRMIENGYTYITDDTHWNINGMRLATKETKKFVLKHIN